MLDRDEIGKIISSARKSKNITQQELAQKLHISDKAISNWETGKNLPNIYFIQQIEKILDVKILQEPNIKTTKNNKVFFTFSLIIVLLTILIVYMFYSEYNNFHVYSISIENEKFNIKDSYIMISKNKIILSMQEITNTKLPYQPEYNIKLSYDLNCSECIIYEKNNYKSLTITKNITDKEFKILKNMELFLIIEYKDYSEKTIKENFSLNFSKEKSNNKTFYKKELSDNDISNENLLHNNGYQKKSNYEYEKIIGNDTYTYNIVNKTLYYKGKKGELTLYGISENNGSNYYVVLNENAIIEYQISGTNTGKKYFEIMLEKLSEINNLTLSTS